MAAAKNNNVMKIVSSWYRGWLSGNGSIGVASWLKILSM
jgi:hypothetical protein